MSEEFSKAVTSILEPVLMKQGFRRIKLKDCICAKYLYQKGRLWFSVSWDWRDQYFDTNLGNLFWFKDVMPRVVVIGDYSCYDKTVQWNSIRQNDDIEKIISKISLSLLSAITLYETDYARIFQNFRVSRGGRSGINIDEFIGNEVDEKSLKPYIA